MRVCTYNIHLWADARGRSNVSRVSALLQRLDCDVVALNEVTTRSDVLTRLAGELRMSVHFASAGFLGNALLSRHPLRDVESFSLAAPEAHAEGRNVLVATVDAPDGAVDVACTHLDPTLEETRLAQVASLHGALRARPAHVLCGDFNALCLGDYDSAALATIAAMRARAHREPPRGEVVAQMDAWGYVDARRASSPAGELPTCWAGTRIDYVFASPALPLAFSSYERVESDASDHAPVVAELSRR